MRLPRLSAAIICLLGVLAVGSGRASADVRVASVPNPTPVSYFAGRLVWSSFDGARNGHVLMTRAGGVTSAVPVAVRTVPFDVDLGPDEQGNTVAVYSRCRREPTRSAAIGNAIINQFPDWRSGRGCDIYEFDFTTARELRVAKANSRKNSEFLPSIWKRRIAFARVYEHRRGRAGDRAHLYAALVTGPSRSRRLPAGPRAADRVCRISPGKRICRVPVELGPTALDLRERRLAFSWETGTGGTCNSSSGVWLDTIGRGRQRVQTVCSGDIQAYELLSPTITGGRIHYGWAAYGDETFSRIRRYDIESKKTEDLLVNPQNRVLLWTAADAATTVYLVSGGYEPGCATVPRVIEPGVGPDVAPCPLNESPG